MSGRKQDDSRDIFDKALDAGPGALAVLAASVVRRRGKIWHNGKWHSENSDDLPTWIRPQTQDESADAERSMRKWLADAAADPRTRRGIAAGAVIGTGAYAANDAVKRRRK